MVNSNIFAELIQSLDVDVLEKLNDGSFYDKEYVEFKGHVCNAGYWATIRSVDYMPKIEKECNDNGDLFCHADDFNRMLIETNALEF